MSQNLMGRINGDSPRVFLAFLKRRPSALIGLCLSIGFLAITLLDLFLPQYLGVANAQNLHSFSDLSAHYRAQPTPPTLDNGWRYLFGTTYLGLPILPVMLASIATDIVYSFFIVFSSMIVGMLIGVFSSFTSRRSDLLVMRGADVFLSFPAILVVMLFSSSEGWSYLNISIGVIVIWWTTYTRIARSSTLPLKYSNYVEAGIASGCSKIRAVFSHIVPNIFGGILVQMTLDIGMVVSIFATVNFLFSPLNTANAFIPEIGNMMVGFPEAAVITEPTYWSQGPPSASILLASGIWWPMIIPGLFLILFIIAINLAGDGIRDYLNPLTRG